MLYPYCWEDTAMSGHINKEVPLNAIMLSENLSDELSSINVFVFSYPFSSGSIECNCRQRLRLCSSKATS